MTKQKQKRSQDVMNSPDVKVRYSQRPSHSLRQNPRSVCSVLAQSNWKVWLAFMPRCHVKSPEMSSFGCCPYVQTTLGKPNMSDIVNVQGDPISKKFMDCCYDDEPKDETLIVAWSELLLLGSVPVANIP